MKVQGDKRCKSSQVPYMIIEYIVSIHDGLLGQWARSLVCSLSLGRSSDVMARLGWLVAWLLAS